MTPEEIERTIEFILSIGARTDARLERNSELIERNSAQIERNSELIERHSEQIAQLTANMELNRQETRWAIDNLIIANEATRDLAQKVAGLQLQMSQWLTNIGNDT
jgi:hypothetical protein